MHADDAGHVDDRARAAAHHPARGGAAGVEGAAQVRGDDVVPVVVGHAGDEAVARDAGVVDEHVQVARLLDEPLRLLGIADVGLDGRAADLARDLLRLVGPGAVADDDLGARARELGGDRAADAARRSGDERALALERGEAVGGARSTSGGQRLLEPVQRGQVVHRDGLHALVDPLD